MELNDDAPAMSEPWHDWTAGPARPRSGLGLSVRDLADLIGGDLLLGTMPPLGGDSEPVGRVVTDSRQVQPGDLFWALPGKTVNGSHFAEEAILRGAQGTVVADRHIEPWGGQFSIRVPHTPQALVRLGQWTRQQFEGNVIAVQGGSGATTTCALIDHLIQSSLRGTCHAGLPSDASRFALAILQWLPPNDYALVEMPGGDEGKLWEISVLCDPQIVVITSTRKSTNHNSTQDLAAFADDLTRLLDSVPSDALIVMHDDQPWLRSATRKHSTKIVWVGGGSDCDIVATNICKRDGCLALTVDRRRFVFPLSGQHHLAAALAALAIGKLLSVSPIDMQAAARNFRRPAHPDRLTSMDRNTLIDDTSEVPSSVSTLREVGATLPPGLERYTR